VTHALGLVIEGMVALLLLLTIGYCTVLNQRLKRLRTDEGSLRAMIGELVAATEKAERAIGRLKQTVQESDHTLGDRIRAAERLATALEQRIDAGGRALGGARHARSEPPPDANAVVAAAQAFAARTRSRMLGRAA
jgi:hypothetical protein